MHLKQLVEKRVGKVTNQEFQFAICNLNLEIEYKFQAIPSIKKMRDILVANIEFYRKYHQLLMEGGDVCKSLQKSN